MYILPNCTYAFHLLHIQYPFEMGRVRICNPRTSGSHQEEIISIATNFSGIPYENIEANKRTVHGYCMSFDCTVLLHQLIHYATLNVLHSEHNPNPDNLPIARVVFAALYFPMPLPSILELNCLPSQILEASLGQR